MNELDRRIKEAEEEIEKNHPEWLQKACEHDMMVLQQEIEEQRNNDFNNMEPYQNGGS